MVERISIGRRVFIISNYTLLISLSILCLVPLIHIFAVSLSSKSAAAGGFVSLWPVEVTLDSYRYVLNKSEFVASMYVTLQRIAAGVSVNMLMTVLIGYPLSKELQFFRLRTFYAWFFVFTVLIGGGLVPAYMIVRYTGIMDTIWALVLPGAVPVFSVVLLLNFFRNLPKELEEAAFMDGAGHWSVLWKIYIPLSAPAIATLTLFSTVGHWNSWFDGIIYMNSPSNYPLQSYLRTVVIERDMEFLSTTDPAMLQSVSDRTSKAAQIFVGALPILMLYPFLQRFFMKGIVVGSVKE
ncbi:carbohydrate ABC transporter permease [Cohnella soli]|uniref:Carbohydrate ABC transporter permease n=1 Tax=Cohnella soli TaxID=425005 RepID=A0ABW0HVW5_9BACL